MKEKKKIREFTDIKDEYFKIKHREKYIEIKKRIREFKNHLRELCHERNLMLKEESEKLVREATIIGSTLIKSQLPPLANELFDTVLIDECSQVSVSLALLGMVKARKWVLVGDHKQLLPIFQTLDPKDKESQRMLSIFCYMLKKYGDRAKWLRWHYRSNDKIIGFSCRYIYEGNITPVEACRKIKLNLSKFPPGMHFLNPEIPVVLLHIEGTESVRTDGSKFNVAEAEVVREIINTLKECGIKGDDVGVITPYRAQRDYIREIIEDESIEVNTVDSFQGREKDVIIFSITSTKDMSSVEDENRLNVTFTRAGKKLIVVGNTKSLEAKSESCGLLAKFASYAKEVKGCFVWRGKRRVHM